jgi:hypothetical protein
MAPPMVMLPDLRLKLDQVFHAINLEAGMLTRCGLEQVGRVTRMGNVNLLAARTNVEPEVLKV